MAQSHLTQHNALNRRITARDLLHHECLRMPYHELLHQSAGFSTTRVVSTTVVTCAVAGGAETGNAIVT